MKGLKKLLCVMGIATQLGLWVALSPSQPVVKAEEIPEVSDLFSGDYQTTKAMWEASDYPEYPDFSSVVTPDQFIGALLEPVEDSQGYSHPVVKIDTTDPVAFDVTVPGEGLYRLAVDFYSLSEDYLDIELAVTVNGETLYLESQQIILYKQWHQSEQAFSLDRYGNDFYGTQVQWQRWIHQSLMDPMGLDNEPLVFKLNAGVNRISLTKIKGSLLLGDITISGLRVLPSYQDYLGDASVVSIETPIEIEAEMPYFKNASSIQAGVSQNVGVTPFSVRYLKLNILDGGTYNSERETIAYQVSVPENGYYQITLKAMQGGSVNSVVYRSVTINGEIPFQEAKAIPFEYSTKWQNVTLQLPSGEPMLFHLEAGENILAFQVDLSPYRDTYHVFQSILKAVNDLSLKIRKLTGNQVDEDRDWDIEEYLPGVSDSLIAMAGLLEDEQNRIATFSETSKLSEVESSLKIAIRNLRFLAKEPNEIPKNIALLATSSSSIASILGNSVSLILTSPLDIDKIYLHGDTDLENPQGNFFTRIWVGIQRFFISFFDRRYIDKALPDELEVWINRPKQYVDLIQKMADEQFTVDTGIKVKASVMAAEGKLILANSAGKNPDVAMGVASWLPYDMGIRGAILDLSTYADDPEFRQTLQLFPEQSLIPMMYDSGLYGLPDTENFYVLFYRTDILSALDIEVPDTWEDVVEILPILKRYGMNFYITLSSSSSLKSFDSTLPFLFQYGSDIYRDDSFAVDLDNENTVDAMTMMTELYTIYSMDVQVSSFYNDFRLGLSPIGVGDFGMYVTLLNAAPDIQGLWSIALLPGVLTGDAIDRSAPGAQTANMIFQKTDKADESWAFLKWWSSTAVQTQFSSLLLSTMGKEYLFNSANTEAFRNLNLASEDIEIILAQWDWLKELPKVPGSYQVELEISNLWNSVVLDRANLRVGLNDGIIKMNKEIVKKMAEFDYMTPDGTVLKPYLAASVTQIRQWIEGEENDQNG